MDGPGVRSHPGRAGRKALRGLESSGLRISLGFLEYLNGDKEAALKELRAAQAAEPGFKKQLESRLDASPELKDLKADKEFLGKLFPAPPAGH